MTLIELGKHRFNRLSDRTKSIAKFVVTSLASRVVGTGSQLIQVPIAVHALGAEAFGFWMLLTSVNILICFSDFGIGLGAQNKMSEAFAEGKERQAREIWGNALLFLIGVWVVLSVLALLVGRLLNFAVVFNLVDPLVRSEASLAATVTLLLFCLNIPLGLSQILAYSQQKAWLQNAALAIGAVGSLIGVFITTRLHGSLTAIIVASQLPIILVNACFLFFQLRSLGWLDLRRIRYQPTVMRDLFKLGSSFGIQQLYFTLVLTLPSILISTTLGAAAVTPYNLGQRFFNLFAVVQNAFMQPLWPAYTNAKARSDWRWIRRMLWLSIGAVMAFTVVPMFIGTFFAKEIIRFWIGKDGLLPSDGLLWALFCWNALMFIDQPFGYLLAGISEIRKLTLYSIVSSVISPPLMYCLLVYLGPTGVVFGMCLGLLPTLILGGIFEVIRVFRNQAQVQRAVSLPSIDDAQAYSR